MLALYQIVLRTGWIFKTESLIMPAVLDSISGAGWVRGWLPLLNRVGQAVPPMLWAQRIKLRPQKKRVVFTSTALMAFLFLGLTSMFAFPLRSEHAAWTPLLFLILYAIFFSCIGVNQVAFATLQGKLIETNRRGHLLSVSNIIGAVTAVACAFLLLPLWLQGHAPRFDLVFGFSGVLFAASAVCALLLVEPADQMRDEPAEHPWRSLLTGCRVLVDDVRFRRLAVASAAFGASFMLFPHYQSLGLRTMRQDLLSLMWWVIIQNIGTGLFSIPLGWIADRHGNRLALQVSLLGVVAAPVFSLLALHGGALGVRAYSLVFVLVGLTPVVLRTFQNYALEFCSPDDHPRYLGVQGLCMSLPIFLSPLAGLCIDRFGFEPVFLVIAAIVLAGWVLTFGMHEPRQAVKVDDTPAL